MGTYTTNYQLFMPTVGETGWGTLVNGNFTTIDTTMSGLNTRVGTLETETDAVEERVTKLETGEFESINCTGTIVGNQLEGKDLACNNAIVDTIKSNKYHVVVDVNSDNTGTVIVPDFAFFNETQLLVAHTTQNYTYSVNYTPDSIPVNPTSIVGIEYAVGELSYVTMNTISGSISNTSWAAYRGLVSLDLTFTYEDGSTTQVDETNYTTPQIYLTKLRSINGNIVVRFEHMHSNYSISGTCVASFKSAKAE